MALDIFVVLIYAAGMLVLGWYGMRRAKTHEDFLVAGRNLGPSFYMGTMAATVLGGASTVGTVRLGDRPGRRVRRGRLVHTPCASPKEWPGLAAARQRSEQGRWNPHSHSGKTRKTRKSQARRCS